MKINKYWVHKNIWLSICVTETTHEHPSAVRAAVTMTPSVKTLSGFQQQCVKVSWVWTQRQYAACNYGWIILFSRVKLNLPVWPWQGFKGRNEYYRYWVAHGGWKGQVTLGEVLHCVMLYQTWFLCYFFPNSI